MYTQRNLHDVYNETTGSGYNGDMTSTSPSKQARSDMGKKARSGSRHILESAAGARRRYAGILKMVEVRHEVRVYMGMNWKGNVRK